MSDWFYGISWLIAVLTPFGLASMIYIPNAQESFGITVLWMSGAGVALSLIRSIFRLQSRGKHLLRQKVEDESLLQEIMLGILSDTDIIVRMRELGMLSVEEPPPD